MSAQTPPGGVPSPPIPVYGPFTGFPPAEVYGQAFFDEAVRHLEDALILHRANRWSAAIASEQKCAELAIKAGLILEGALGWWDKLQQTHAPFDLIRKHVVLKSHAHRLEVHNPKLGPGLEAMEKLVSDRRGGDFEFEKLVNSEYPFFFVGEHPSTNIQGAYVLTPGTHFGEPDSRLHYATARDLLAAYQAMIPTVGLWGHNLPPPL